MRVACHGPQLQRYIEGALYLYSYHHSILTYNELVQVVVTLDFDGERLSLNDFQRVLIRDDAEPGGQGHGVSVDPLALVDDAGRMLHQTLPVEPVVQPLTLVVDKN